MRVINIGLVTTCSAHEATVMLQSTNHVASYISSDVGLDLLDLDTAKILNIVKKDGVGSLDVVLEELEKLVPATLDSAHNSDQSLITSEYDVQVACGTNRNDAEMALTWSSFGAKQSTHKDCRSVQKEADDDQASKCTAESDWLTAKSTGCMLDACDLSLGSDAGTVLRSLVAELTTFADEADTHKTNCDDATQTNAAQALECSDQQVLVEESYCTWFELQKSQWETYSSCRADIDGDYNSSIETVQENEKSRHLQFKQYQNIVCLLKEVVTANSTIDEAELTARMNNCEAQDVDTSSYDIDYPGVVALDPNPNADATLTTESAWVATYLNDLAIGPADVQAVCPSDYILRGTVMLKSVRSGFYAHVRLDGSDDSFYDEVRHQDSDSEGSQWEVEVVDEGIVMLKSVRSGNYLRVRTSAPDSGDPVYQWSHSGLSKDGSEWVVEKVNGGMNHIVLLKSVRSGYYLHVSSTDNHMDSGAIIYHQDSTSEGSQWEVQET